jgi:hypothetical protein
MYSWTEWGKAYIYPQDIVLFVLILSFFQMSEDEEDDSLVNEDESNEVIFTDVSPTKVIVYI